MSAIENLPREARVAPFRITPEQYAATAHVKGKNRLLANLHSKYRGSVPIANHVCMLRLTAKGTRAAFLLCEMEGLEENQLLCFPVGIKLGERFPDVTVDVVGYDLADKDNCASLNHTVAKEERWVKLTAGPNPRPSTFCSRDGHPAVPVRRRRRGSRNFRAGDHTR